MLISIIKNDHLPRHVSHLYDFYLKITVTLFWKGPFKLKVSFTPYTHISHVFSGVFSRISAPLWHKSLGGIGWHNAPGHLCHLGADILVCHPRRHVILIMYTVASTQIVFGDNSCRYTCIAAHIVAHHDILSSATICADIDPLFLRVKGNNIARICWQHL